MEWLILDEADKLFEEGKDGFREQVIYLYLAVLFTQENCLSHFGKKSVLEPSLVQLTNECFFQIQIATIYQACDKPEVKRALFSATMSNGIDEWARIHLDNVVQVTIGIRYCISLFLRTPLESSVIQDPLNSSPEIFVFTNILKMSF